MTITVIIPTYNVGREIADCLNSLQAVAGEHLGRSILVHIQDGNSTDDTLVHARGCGIPGLRLVSEADSGVYSAMNRAVALSETEWVYFLGADDRLAPGFLRATESLERSDTIYYANVTMKSDGRVYDGKFSRLKLVYRNICHQALFTPRHILWNSPFDTTLPIHADWAKNIELFASTDFHYLPYTVCEFNDLSGLSHCNKEHDFSEIKARLFQVHHNALLALLSKHDRAPTRLYHRLRRRV